MFERFTDRARRVVVLAQEEARMLNHNYIGTEHLLLGLLHEDEGMAAQVLSGMDVSLSSVREQVLEIIGTGEAAPSGHIPFTPRAKKVLELSLREALQLGTDYIGTEHLLLGLLREGEGVAAQILVKLGKNLNMVREAVVTLYRQQPPDYSSPRDPVPVEPVAAEASSGSGPRPPMLGFLSRRSTRPASAPVLREYVPGLAHLPVRSGDPVVPRQTETELLMAALARRERNNALVIGPSGSGKSALVRGLGHELTQGRGPASLSGAVVLQLDPPALRTGVDRLARRSASPIVLVEDLDLLLGADDSPGGRLILAIAALADAEEPLIVTATPQAREQLESRLPTFAARFEQVELANADGEHTLAVLQLLRPGLQEFHKITIEDAALTAAVELAQESSGTPGARALPGAAVDLLDAAAARLATQRELGLEETAVLRELHLRPAS
jgi:ATP-dependent Clp protease ATP-binding subunit ClpC